MPVERAKAVDKDVNLLEGLPWTGNPMTLDPTEDAWERGAPPPPNIGKVELIEFGTIFRKYNEKDETTWSYIINIQGTLQEGEYKGSSLFHKISTYVGRGKRNSTAVGAMYKFGYGDKLKKDGNGLVVVEPGKLAVFLKKVLDKGPIVTWEWDWRAGYTDKGGKFHEICSTYEDFPLIDEKNPSKGRRHQVKVTSVDGGTETINAQTNVIYWFGKDEKVESKRGTSKAVAVTGTLNASDLGDLELGDATAGVKANSVAKGAVQDELSLDI